MTVPTHTLLKQLAGEVEWFDSRLFLMNLHNDDVDDHYQTALEIIEELEGRETVCSECLEPGKWTGLSPSEEADWHQLADRYRARALLAEKRLAEKKKHESFKDRMVDGFHRYQFALIEKDLRRLHDLILEAVGPMDIQTGAASCAAMDLIRGMIGGER